jgi:glutathione S-transferase
MSVVNTSALTLVDWRPSPFCMKVRGVLHHKGLAYRRLPALSNLGAVRREGIGKVPLLRVGEEVFIDSTDIVHELERRFPTPSVLPSDPRDAALSHALEDWADESLYFAGLHAHWVEPAGRAQAAAYFARTWLGMLAFRPFLGRIRRQLEGQGTGRKSLAHVRADLERNLDALESMLEDRPHLLGAGPYLCDFAVASQLAYLELAPSTAPLVHARTATTAFLERMRLTCGEELPRPGKT